MMKINSVGMIGLGVLGSAIAPNILKSGVQLLVNDIDRDKVNSITNDNIIGMDSITELCKKSDIVITCLPSTNALESVVEEIATSISNPLVIEISTLSLKDKLRAKDRLKGSDIEMLDCPVSGNRIAALASELTAFCSGSEETFSKINFILQSFCRETHYVGEFGAGIKTKMCGNILNLVHNAVAAEAIVLAMKSGLDPELFHKTISGSFSSSRVFEIRGKLMVDDDYEREGMNFSTPMKDSKIIADHAIDMNCPIPLYQTAMQSYHTAIAHGLYGLDQSAVCKVMEKATNLDRKKIKNK